MHDVDEDMRTLLEHGGDYGIWWGNTKSGVFLYVMYDPTAHVSGTVASRCRHPKLIKYYTDAHDVDEDTRTVCNYGGWCSAVSWAGIACRDMTTNPTSAISDFAASRCRHLKKSLIIRIGTMSTKNWVPARFKVDVGMKEPNWVS